MITHEVIANFAEFAATYSPPDPTKPEHGERRVVPESFFWASKYPRATLTHIHRFHFAPAFGDTRYSWTGNSKDDIHFTLENGQIGLKGITWRAEDYSQFAWIADFSPEITTQFANRVGYDSLTIGYGKSGGLQTVAYHYDDGKQEVSAFYDRIEMRQLRQQAEEGFLTLPVESPNAQAVIVPTSIDRQKIISGIVDPVLFIDPFNAPPEVDNSWRSAHWPSIIGVKLIPAPNTEGSINYW